MDDVGFSGVGDQQIEWIIFVWRLGIDEFYGLADRCVFQSVETEYAAGTTARVRGVTGVTIEDSGQDAMLVNAEPRTASEQILSTVDPRI